MDSQQVQMSTYGVLFVFMSLMKSLSMVARTEVLRRNTPGDWSVKDRTSCVENLHLRRENDIIKIMQVEGAKCIITWVPTGAMGRPNWAELGLGQWAQAGRHSPVPVSVRPPFPCTWRTLKPWRHRHSAGREPYAPGDHPRARERREISGGRSTISKEAPTSGEEGRHRSKRHHDQRCYV
jgi:hypothetical protein